tara:strand:- start:77 stop:1309 length:1233 start_codon:yes stop_codon:yes gene_type:complete
MFIKLALKSLFHRKGSVLLSIFAISVSIFVILGVEHIRYQTKENFSNTVSGIDLIVGGRTSSINLLLYSVFRIGSPTNNIRWETFEKIVNNKNVKWAIPISLGDSHKGYPVIGTTKNYFQYFSYGKNHSLLFSKGQPFNQTFDLVLGSDVAKKLGYKIGDKLILAHGLSKVSFSLHSDSPFTVVGVLLPTGTPIDRTLHVSLQGIEAIHLNWQDRVKNKNSSNVSKLQNYDLKPKNITAFMLGLKSKISTFKVQRDINSYLNEPISAILPGVALSELWQMMRILEDTLFFISILVFLSVLLGLSSMMLSSIKQRSYEIQLLRIIGAPKYYLFLLIELEVFFIILISIFFGAGVISICLFLSKDYLLTSFGLQIGMNIFNQNTLFIVFSIVISSLIIAIVPSLSSYFEAKK